MLQKIVPKQLDQSRIAFPLLLVTCIVFSKTTFLLLPLIATLTFCTGARADKPAQLSMELQTEGPNFKALHIVLAFEGEDDGETILRLPNEWGGQTDLFRAIRNLQVDQAELLPTDQASQKRLKHAPKAWITLQYDVVDDENGPAFHGRGNDYRMRIRDQFLFGLGEAYVIQPESVSHQSHVQVSFKFPETVTWTSDLEHQRNGRKLTFGDIQESVLMAGDIRIVDAGGGARLAIRGEISSRSDTQWRDAFQQISRAQREYWGADDEPFLVTILTSPPPSPGSISLGGTGRSDAFAFFATTNAEPKKLDQIMAHEMMHTWVPRRIGGLRRTPPEQQDYWLSEGFTDWASWRVLVRSGFWSAEDFANAFNEHLRDYDLSEFRVASNERIVSDFWKNPAVSDLPYRRGMLLAMYWDMKVLLATDGRRDFDDILLHMQQLSKAKPMLTATQLLAIAMSELAGIDIESDLAQYVEQGQAVDLPENLFVAGSKLQWIERPSFHRGFDIEATQRNGNTISGVLEGGPAWRAGLRNGMKLLGRKGGQIGNSQVELAYEVQDGDNKLVLKWMPEGDRVERFRMLKLPDEFSEESRLRFLARAGGANPR